MEDPLEPQGIFEFFIELDDVSVLQSMPENVVRVGKKSRVNEEIRSVQPEKPLIETITNVREPPFHSFDKNERECQGSGKNHEILNGSHKSEKCVRIIISKDY